MKEYKKDDLKHHERYQTLKENINHFMELLEVQEDHIERVEHLYKAFKDLRKPMER